MTPYTSDWLARGNDDMKTIEILLAREGVPAVICFHAQQAGEKYLKGFLAFHEKYIRKVHDLSVLLDACMAIDPTFESLQEAAGFLNQFYLESRYPDDYIEFHHADAQKASDAALRIKEFVLGKLNKPDKNQKGFITTLLVIIVAVLVGATAYLALRSPAPAVQNSALSPTQNQLATATPFVDKTADWKTYSFPPGGNLQIDYPSDLHVTEIPGGFVSKAPSFAFPSSYLGPALTKATISFRASVNKGGTGFNSGSNTVNGQIAQRIEINRSNWFKTDRVQDTNRTIAISNGTDADAEMDVFTLSMTASNSAGLNNDATQNIISIFEKMVASFNFSSYLPGQTAKSSSIQAANETTDWKTATVDIGPGAQFKVQYPPDWDNSELKFPCANIRDASIGIISPVRIDVSAAYLIQFCISDKVIIAYQGFIRAPLSAQPTEKDKVLLTDRDLQATKEYSIAQQIISTSKFIK